MKNISLYTIELTYIYQNIMQLSKFIISFKALTATYKRIAVNFNYRLYCIVITSLKHRNLQTN